MSLPTISINLDFSQDFQNIAQTQLIRNELRNVLRLTLRNVLRKMIQYLRRIVPEDTGQLLASSIKTLNSSSVSNSFITVKYGYPVAYADYVNRMVGVNWTKTGSESHFYEKGLAFLYSQLRLELEIQIRKRLDSARLKEEQSQAWLLLLIALQSQFNNLIAGGNQ